MIRCLPNVPPHSCKATGTTDRPIPSTRPARRRTPVSDLFHEPEAHPKPPPPGSFPGSRYVAIAQHRDALQSYKPAKLAGSEACRIHPGGSRGRNGKKLALAATVDINILVGPTRAENLLKTKDSGSSVVPPWFRLRYHPQKAGGGSTRVGLPGGSLRTTHRSIGRAVASTR